MELVWGLIRPWEWDDDEGSSWLDGGTWEVSAVCGNVGGGNDGGRKRDGNVPNKDAGRGTFSSRANSKFFLARYPTVLDTSGFLCQDG